MQLLVIRHAIAEEREEFAATGQSDDLRPLTAEGIAKMRRVVMGLRTVVPRIELLAASPLLRAAQTADIVASAYGGLQRVTTGVLTPDAAHPALVQWLRSTGSRDVVAIVGHEPHLSAVVSWLLAGGTRSFVSLKKGGACLLDFENEIAADAATLRWSLTPSQLRALRE
jgi:phosphohistidine phosphatase